MIYKSTTSKHFEVVLFWILLHNRTCEPSRELWPADGGSYLGDTRIPESYIHFHSTWLVKLRHPYLMSCSCFPENLLSPADSSPLPRHTNHLFLIRFPCGPWHPFSLWHAEKCMNPIWRPCKAVNGWPAAVNSRIKPSVWQSSFKNPSAWWACRCTCS